MIVAVALDLGTTAIKAGLLSQDGTLSGIISRSAPEITADGGHYESDASAYAETADAVLAACLAQTGASYFLPQTADFVGNVSEVRPRHGGAEPSGAGAGASHFLPQTADFVGNVSEVRPPLGLCSQRSSFLIWERASGRPVTPLISWQDDRGAESCVALCHQEGTIRDLSGLPLTPYYFAPKLSVLLRQHPSWRELLLRGEWLLGTLDTFLAWRWTGGKHHLTDASMAARTVLMDIHRRQWSSELCALFDVPQRVLPQIHPSAGLALRLENGLVLQASVGDQSAALVSSIALGEREALVNLGTGGFVVCFLPDGRSVPDGYLKTLVWQEGSQLVHFACEGTLNSIAAALAPYPANACDPEDLASDNVYCLAEPSGLGAPYFRRDLGITFSESVEHLSPRHIALLLQEGIIFRVARILEDFLREFGIERAYLSGGLAGLPCLQQGIAQCVPLAIYRLLQTEASLTGAALLAAGDAFGSGRRVEKIELGREVSGLSEKYIRWKAWLDGLLDSRPARSSSQILR